MLLDGPVRVRLVVPEVTEMPEDLVTVLTLVWLVV